MRVKVLSNDFLAVRSILKFRFWNRNVVGTQFGGSIYSMTDPIYMLMLMKNLGRDFIISDKAASIKYIKPGLTDLVADFVLTEEDLELVRKIVREHGKMHWVRTIELKDKEGAVVAEIRKVISIKLKNYKSKD